MDNSPVMDLVRRQHGVLAWWQVRALGAPRSTYLSTTRGGVDLARGVRLAGAARYGSHARAAAAVLAAGPHAVASSDTALWLHGIERRPPETLTVVLPETQRRPATPPEAVHYLRTRTLEPRDRTTAVGIPCATIPRAYLDLAKRRHVLSLRASLLSAAQAGRLPRAAVLHRALDARFSTGRRHLLRTMHELDPEACDSILVDLVRRRLRDAGFEPDARPQPVDVVARHLHPDITYAEHRVAVECDGFAFHSTPAALDLDHRKSNAYLVAGWTPLRIAWVRLDEDWPGFVAELAALLAPDRVRP